VLERIFANIASILCLFNLAGGLTSFVPARRRGLSSFWATIYIIIIILVGAVIIYFLLTVTIGPTYP